jgi:hypothetical protein
MQRAFLAVEGTLALELLTPSRICITEELLRTAMIRGLAAANPEHAGRIETERSVTWTTNESWSGSKKRPAQGRPIQHDIYIAPIGEDKGLACEVKWLKNENSGQLIKDIWKLALSRGVDNERKHSLRTFLLVGGERKAFSDTINVLYNHKPRLADLRRQKTKGQLPKPIEISLKKWLNTEKGRNGFSDLIKWGAPATFREPPPTRDRFWVYTRGTWLRPRNQEFQLLRGGTLTWNAVLWELSAEGLNERAAINWADWKQDILDA